MRGIGKHTPPEHMQPEPPDNTSRYVTAQAQTWKAEPAGTLFSPKGWPGPETRAGQVIHTESAREIAAWFQSLGTDGIEFATFASSGTITEDLAADIEREIRKFGPNPTNAEHEAFICPLRALDAYVRACTVTVYTVGKNTAGYLPETDVFATLDREDAQQTYNDMLRNDAPEDVARTDECTCSDADLCELCTVDALVRGMIADGDTAIDEKGTSALIHADSWAGSMSYWVNVESMTYGQYLEEYGRSD